MKRISMIIALGLLSGCVYPNAIYPLMMMGGYDIAEEISSTATVSE